MRRVNFDLDVLRSFATGMDLGSFAKAADRLGRSTSAVSAQLKKLEDQAGTPIFRKSGRGLTLTEAGETMLAYARRLIELNDEAAAAMSEGLKLQLHARRIELPHPSRGTLIIEAPISRELKLGFDRFGFDQHEAEADPFPQRGGRRR